MKEDINSLILMEVSKEDLDKLTKCRGYNLDEIDKEKDCFVKFFRSENGNINGIGIVNDIFESEDFKDYDGYEIWRVMDDFWEDDVEVNMVEISF